MCDVCVGDEVEEMLDSLSGAVNADVGSELINSHHTSALLLRQLLQQADKWYLQMTADISAMENRYSFVTVHRGGGQGL